MEKPEGGWYEAFAARAVPEPELGYDLLAAIGRILRLWRDPEVGPWMAAVLGIDDAETPDDSLLSPEDLPDLLGVPLSPDAAWALTEGVIDQLSYFSPFGDEARDVPELVQIAMIGMNLDERARGKPRLVPVKKRLAFAKVKEWHSALDEANYRGLLYSFGVAVGPRLVAVALVNTPSGGWGRADCPQAGMIELSRIASDGSTLGASSMLAARAMDLLPFSGRRGADPCLFVTYSLLSEAGTTYLALADKGLRPTAVTKPTRREGGRGSESLGDEPKIRWEAGPRARPADWQAMRQTPASPGAVASAQRAFEAWQARDIRATVKKSFSGQNLPPVLAYLTRRRKPA